MAAKKAPKKAPVAKKASKAKPAVSKAKPSKAIKAKPAKEAAKKVAKAEKPTDKKAALKPVKATAPATKETAGPAKEAKAPKSTEAKGKPVLKAVPTPAVLSTPAPEPEIERIEAQEEEAPRHVVSLRQAMEKPIVEKKKKKDDLKIDRTGNLEQQWKTLFEKSKSLKPAPYKMSESYEARTALQHKVLGWGYVLTSQNNRLEVLFQDGIKILISNYKA